MATFALSFSRKKAFLKFLVLFLAIWKQGDNEPEKRISQTTYFLIVADKR